MSTLPSKLRRDLERTVVKARTVAEVGARDALHALTVHESKRGSHLSDEQADLRNRLRAHARQLGDRRDANGNQAIDRLVDECAYEHWHRMLFARFLAENDLLVEPEHGVAVSLADIEELARRTERRSLGAGQSLCPASLATNLPRRQSRFGLFALPRETRLELEQLVESLPTDVFKASDALGWGVPISGRPNGRREVNASEVKIGAREISAVTQLFTEPYMVSFLLDNSLGAWWAARRLTEEDFQTAGNEQELREKAALPGVPLEYLRFVRTPSGDEGEGEEEHWPVDHRPLELLTRGPNRFPNSKRSTRVVVVAIF